MSYSKLEDHIAVAIVSYDILADDEQIIEAYQYLIDKGLAWNIGKIIADGAQTLIDEGKCVETTSKENVNKEFVFRKKFIENSLSYDDEPLKGFVYYQDSFDHDYLENNFHIQMVSPNESDSRFYVLIERSEYTAQSEIELEQYLKEYISGEYQTTIHNIKFISDY